MLRTSVVLVCALFTAGVAACIAEAGDTFGTTFTFQGRLNDTGTPVNEPADFRFRLYTTVGGGTQAGTQQVANAVDVEDGSFLVNIDFGASAFNGDPRWLEIDVRVPSGGGTFTTLSPRQQIRPTPYAIRASSAPWAGITDVPATFPPASHSATLITSGTLADARLSGNVVKGDAVQTITGAKYFMGAVGVGTNAPTQTFDAWGDVVFGGGLGGTTDGASEFLSFRGQSAQWSIGAENTASASTTGFFIGTSASDFDTFYLDRNGELSMGGSVFLSPDATGIGRIWTLGPNGNLNTQLTNHSSSDNNGAVSVHDSNGVVQALMAVGVGGGFVSASVKNFRMANPQDAETEIVYACIEGPEAAAYVRGTATLVNGAAVVKLPVHFTDVAAADGMTVQLTPRSADSRGLAVVARSTSSFEVRELMSGTGAYEFDWEVKAVRLGYEDYKVIQPKLQLGVPAANVR